MGYVHKNKGIEPRSALLCAFLLSLLIACLTRVLPSLAALGVATFLFALSRQNLKILFKPILAANAFIFMMWLVVPWTTPGAVIWQNGIINITKEGFDLCLLATLKANAILVVFLALVSPLSISGMGGAMLQLGCPEKLVWLLLLMGRNIHLLERELSILWAAAKLRGFRPRTDLHTYKTIASFLAILLARGHERASITREAMLLRGFSGILPVFESTRPCWRDIFLSLLCLLCGSIILFLEWGHA